MELPEEIAAMRAGTGDPGALLGEFRRAAVLVPTLGPNADQLLTRSFGGVRWILAFTDEAALARFARESGGAPDEPWEYASVLGARLLDAVIPALDGPTGVAVDVADEDGSMLFPPVPGIVPDEVAVGSTAEGEGA
ncbi:SseB family protein [Streptomyces sp. 8N114]|uniref:SseB family protein n=1 Tax=Streptomyces sp. 8N114 TaxID=3457419 RepID=UPI003FD22A34